MKVVISAYVRFRNALAWHAFELARGLTAAGHETLLLCQQGSPLANWCRSSGLNNDDRFHLRHFSVSEAAAVIRDYRTMIREFQPDVLNPHCPPGHTYLALARRMEKSRIPLIRTVADPRPLKRNPLNRYLNLRLTDGVLFTTASSLRRYEAVFKDNRPPHRVILPGFRADDFIRDVPSNGYRGRLGISDDCVLIGVIARMSPEKGQEVLLEALNLLTEAQRARIAVVLAGEDSRERNHHDLHHLAQEFGVDSRVHFLGELADVRPLMSELDIGIITSTRSEAICRVALEYMSFAKPVIASNVNILPEVVSDGTTGWIFENKNPHTLARCLCEAMERGDERTRRGKAGASLVRTEFTIEREVAETLSLYQQIIMTRNSTA